MSERRLKDSDVNRQLLASSRRVKKLYQFFAVIIATAFISSAITLTISADGPTGFGTVIEPGSMVTHEHYLIYQDDGIIYAKNANTGASDYSSSNASAVINYALSNLPATGGGVKIKLASYNITWPISISSDNTYLVGEQNGNPAGLTGTVLRKVGSINLLVIDGSISDRLSFITVKDLAFNNSDNTGGFGVYARYNSYLRFENCMFYGFDSYGLYVFSAYSVQVSKCAFWQCGDVSTSRAVLKLTGDTTYKTTAAIIEDCIFEVSNYRSVHCDYIGDTVTVTNCYFEGSATYGKPTNFIYFDGPNTLADISNNWMYDSLGACILLGANSAGTRIIGNCIEGADTYGIDASLARRSIITNNQIRLCSLDGLRLGDYSICSDNIIAQNDQAGIYVSKSYCLIACNQIQQNGQDNTGVQAAVYLNSSTYCQVTSNRIYDLNSYYQDYGIQEANSANYNVVTNNYIANAEAGPIVLLGANSVATNNIGWATENSGAATITGSVNSVTVNHGCAATPTVVVVTGNNTGIGNYYVSSITSSQFVITFENQPGASIWKFYWYAEV